VTVEREYTMVVAAAEVNDECGVDVVLFGDGGALSTAEARAFADELRDAADEADAAALEALAHPVAASGFDVDAPPSRTRFSGEG